MLRGLLAIGIGIVLGFIFGSLSGFRAAVTDYVENDARKIEQLADSMYGEAVDAEELPEPIREMMEGEATGSEADTDGNRSFQ